MSTVIVPTCEFSTEIRKQLPTPQLPPAGNGLPTLDKVEREIANVLERQLSPALEHWVQGYAKVGRRNTYLWKWCRQGVEVTTLPCVLPGLKDQLCDTKVLGVILDVLLDDVADMKGHGELLEHLLSLLLGHTAADFSRFDPDHQPLARFTFEVWREIHRRAESYPRFDEYKALLRFDYLQLFNVMRYSCLLNQNLALLNLVEHDLYTPHNMHMMISSTLDLMCSPAFDRSELGKVREVVWNGQCMGRIGNLVTTWQRELGEGDYTSGVYARAVGHGHVTSQELQTGDRKAIESAILEGGHEAYFLCRWQEHRQFLLSRKSDLHSFDVGQLVAGLERLICLHLGSRGYK